MVNLRDRLLPALSVAVFFISTVFIFAPSHLFLTNSNEFNAYYFELLGYLALIGLPFLLLVVTLLVFIPGKRDLNKKFVVVILSLAFLLWLQGNILVWNYGELTGYNLTFNPYFMAFVAVIWCAIIFWGYKKYLFFYKHAHLFSLVFIVVQIVSVTILMFQQPETSTQKQYAIDTTNEFTFSQERNVIILVLDTFQSDAFEKIVSEDESYKDIFDGFTYYRNSLAGFPTTFASIPNILTGRFYDNSIPFSSFLESAFYSSSSIPKVLKDNGFVADCYSIMVPLDKQVISNAIERTRIDVSTLASIYDVALFRYSPDFFKQFVYNGGEWFLKYHTINNQIPANTNRDPGNTDGATPFDFDEKALTLKDVVFARDLLNNAAAMEQKPVFKFYRLDGCHPPYLLNEDLSYEKMTVDGYGRQAKASLKIAGMFLGKLKSLGLFDNSLIFIIGDHGTHTGESYLHESANPLFLVKNFGSKGQMVVSNGPVCLSDIPNTVFSELGLTEYVTGKSVFEIGDSDYRERLYYHYFWQKEWTHDFFSTIKKYVVSGPAWLEASWHFTGQELRPGIDERSLAEWEDGFYWIEGTEDNNWRWCSSEGKMIINNGSNKDQKFLISTRFFSGYPEISELNIESRIFSEKLYINNTGYSYKKEIIVSPGSHTIQLRCNAQRIIAPEDRRFLVFKMENFRIEAIR